jgi:hypothetical protein
VGVVVKAQDEFDTGELLGPHAERMLQLLADSNRHPVVHLLSQMATQQVGCEPSYEPTRMLRCGSIGVTVGVGVREAENVACGTRVRLY